MIIEKYVANPAATTWNYVTVVLNKTYVAKSFCVMANCYAVSFADSFIAIYRGSVTSYDAGNNDVALFACRWLLQGAVTSNSITPNGLIHVCLPPGTYTFAVYNVTDVANLQFVFHLDEVV